MTDRNCEEIFARLSEYLDRELPPASCSELEEHLKDCPECIQFVDSLRRSVDLCRHFGAERPADPVNPEVLDRLHSAYAQMLARRRGGKA